MGIKIFKHGNMDFRKRVILNLWIGIIVTVLSISALTFMYVTQSMKLITHINDFILGYYTGLCGGAIVGGIVTIIKNLTLLKNGEKFKKAKTEYSDEREKFLGHQTAYIGCLTMYFMIFLSLLITPMINITVFFTLFWVFMAFAGIMVVTKLVLKKIY